MRSSRAKLGGWGLGLGGLAAACSLTSSLDDLRGDWPKLDSGTDQYAEAEAGADASDAADAADSSDADAPSCDADTQNDPAHCGSCANACAPYEECVAGQCKPCDSATEDCDGDGWLVSEGDCCDKPGACGPKPELVNPGALEIVGNGLDDNCNGQTDLFDTIDTLPCDKSLYSNSAVAMNYARALGLCRTTETSPASKQDKTWGVIEAELLRADGSPLGDTQARSIRTGFGAVTPGVLEGESIVVLSTGIASDASQTNPGPNGGAPAGYNVSNIHAPASSVDLSTCTDPRCINDWFATENLPLKQANQLPTTPGCDPGSFTQPAVANDSVMLRLVLRAPTNMQAFSLSTYFLSAEYPEFVCTNFNDQFVALIDTPTGAPLPIPNPADKNLLTYAKSGKKWPIGINVAHGTNLFSVCETEAQNAACWDKDVDSLSCGLGAAQLTGTGFEKASTGTCTIGGGTHWLTVGGNVVPGRLVTLRIVIWDVGDSSFDSTALIDGFKWLPDPIQPGTT